MTKYINVLGNMKYNFLLVLFVLTCNILSRAKLQDDSNNYTNGVDDIKRQLEEVFDNVKTMIKMGNKGDALDLLQANCEVVKEQLKAGFKGIEQAALLDVLALGYMGIGEFKIAERLLQLVIGLTLHI